MILLPSHGSLTKQGKYLTIHPINCSTLQQANWQSASSSDQAGAQRSATAS